MVSRLFRQLFGPGDRAGSDFAGEGRQAIFLHGRGDYNFDATGVSRHQVELREIAGDGDARAGQELECVAALVVDENTTDRRFTVAVAIDRRVVGYCPANLATQYREWLHKWGLSDASVFCHAVIVVGRNPSKPGTNDYTVKLDIEQPFKMTTL